MSTSSFAGLLRSVLAATLLSFMAVAQAADTGLLWKVQSPDGKSSYLFGTMHTDDARVTDFSPQLEQALADSDAFARAMLPEVHRRGVETAGTAAAVNMNERDWTRRKSMTSMA